MLSEIILTYIIFFVILEFYEVQWQKATTMMRMLARMYKYYQSNIFFFFFRHPTFYLSIYLMILTDYNIYAVSIFFIKVVDIAMKVMLIKQIFIDKKMSHELSLALLAPLPKGLPYIGLLLYPVLVFLAFVS